jgi:hypothetical protein
MTGTKRINRGNGHSYLLDGDKVDGVTTVIGNGYPKPALVGWAARTIAEFVGERLDIDPEIGTVGAIQLVAALKTIDLEQRKPRFPADGTISRLAIIDTLKGVHWRERDQAARRGTEVHSYGERLVHGEPVEVPEELDGHVKAYIQFLDDFDPEPVLVEVTVGNRTHHWMGTLDLIADIRGERWLLDIKTTRSGIYPETALQLAAYRHAEFYLDADGQEHPMLEVDRVGAIWVRADGYDLIEVDASRVTYNMFRYVQQVARFQTITGAEVILGTVQP